MAFQDDNDGGPCHTSVIKHELHNCEEIKGEKTKS